MERIKKKYVSFGEAFEYLKKFRYQSRQSWSKEQKSLFRICNFIVLSKKRINKVFSSLDSFSKLSDKSHYKYNQADIHHIKELLLDNMERCFQKFDKKLNFYKHENITKIQEHFDKLRDENLRLTNENKRLNFVIESYIAEKKLNDINEIQDILKDKPKKNNVTISNKINKIEKNNLKKFIEKWEKGLTSLEINDQIDSENLILKKEVRKKYKL
ncbi:MAG: hypothetical protein ACJ0GH_03550 [Alphaproteobacteria bacterium]